jgi:hypothetical protein
MCIAKPAAGITIDAGPRAMPHACHDLGRLDCNENVICMRDPRKWRVTGQDVSHRAAAQRGNGADGAQTQAFHTAAHAHQHAGHGFAAMASREGTVQQHDGQS